MTIHLLRHFKVMDNTNSWLNPSEFNAWVKTYDTLPLKVIDVNLSDDIDGIYCSTLSRARRTVASLSTSQTIIYTDQLVEVGSRVFFDTSLKLEKYIWFGMGSLLWYFNKLEGENKRDSKVRAKKLIDMLKSSKKENVLLVSHGFFMRVLAKELESNGFKGEIDFRPRNAKIYTFNS